MALEINKTFTVRATPAEVWAFLLDVPRAARCMPGATIGERLDDRTYAGTMTVKVGPITANYKGKLVFERLDEAARTAESVATGQEARGKGGADMRMTGSVREVAPGETEVTAVSRVNISGILAQMGRGMIQDVSDQLFQMFSQRMRAELEQAAPDATVSPSASEALSPAPAALDVGSLGARAAGHAASRTLLRPGSWLVVPALCLLACLPSR